MLGVNALDWRTGQAEGLIKPMATCDSGSKEGELIRYYSLRWYPEVLNQGRFVFCNVSAVIEGGTHLPDVCDISKHGNNSPIL